MPDTVKILQDYGVSPTPQRIAVAEAVLHAKAHPSADDIWGIVRRQWPTLSRTTVYNTLNLLVGKGVLKPQIIKEGKIVYDGSFDGLRRISGSLSRISLTMENGQPPAIEGARLLSARRGVYEFEVDLDQLPVQELLRRVSLLEEVRDVELGKAPIEEVIAGLYTEWKNPGPR